MLHNLMIVGLLLVVCGFVANVEGYKTAAEDPLRPSYIPRDYIQIEDGAIDLFYEWWLRDANSNATNNWNPRKLIKTRYQKPLYLYDVDIDVPDLGPDYRQIYFLHNEDNYFFLKTDDPPAQGYESYQLMISNITDTSIQDRGLHIAFKNGDTYPSSNKYSFFCDHLWIINSTHLVDTAAMFKAGNDEAKAQNYTDYSVFILKSFIQEISTVSNKSCLTDGVRNMIHLCFIGDNRCGVDLGGQEPKLVISREHLVQVHNGYELILRYHNDGPAKEIPYHVIKYKNLYFYFPQNLKTSSDHELANIPKAKRISVVPRLQASDKIWVDIANATEIINGNGTLYPSGAGNIIINNPVMYLRDLYVFTHNGGALTLGGRLNGGLVGDQVRVVH